MRPHPKACHLPTEVAVVPLLSGVSSCRDTGVERNGQSRKIGLETVGKNTLLSTFLFGGFA